MTRTTQRIAGGAGHEVPVGPPGLYIAPGVIGGVEFSQFTGAVTESEIAPMVLPYAEAGYRFDFGLTVGLQTGLKMLFYIGAAGAAERSMVAGPVVSYTFGN